MYIIVKYWVVNDFGNVLIFNNLVVKCRFLLLIKIKIIYRVNYCLNNCLKYGKI